MKLKHITLTNYRCFKNLHVELDPRLTAIIAPNGLGKTSILDAIATALGPFLTRLPNIQGKNPLKTDFRTDNNGSKPPYMRISCESSDNIKWDRTEKRDNSPQTAKDIPEGIALKQIHEYSDTFIDANNAGTIFELPMFLYYGAGRAVYDVPSRKRGFTKNFNRFDALSGALESRTNFKRIVHYFYFLEEKENKYQKEKKSFDVEIPELMAIRKAINILIPHCSNPRTVRPAGIEVDWGPEHAKVPLRIEQLSDGYKTSLAMVMDIAARMAEANPHMKNPLETEGIILIDEVDLHIHPSWQEQFLPKLMSVFPNIQFIISTHSPFILQSLHFGRFISITENYNLSYGNFGKDKSIEDIAEEWMGLKNLQRSLVYKRRTKLTKEYFEIKGSENEYQKTNNLIQLVKLDDSEETQTPLTSWRRSQFRQANFIKERFAEMPEMLDAIPKFVKTGAWSVWMTVFKDQPEVTALLLNLADYPNTINR